MQALFAYSTTSANGTCTSQVVLNEQSHIIKPRQQGEQRACSSSTRGCPRWLLQRPVSQDPLFPIALRMTSIFT